MTLRNWTALSALLLVVAFSQVAAAQVNPTLAAPKNGQPATADAALNNVIDKLEELHDEVQTLKAEVSALSTNVTAMQNGFSKQMDINYQLEKQLKELSDRVEKIVVGGSAGGPGTNFIRSIQDDPILAGDFQKVVQGKVIFDNQTGQAQRIFVNGAEWEVITGRSSMLVPYGRVTFHTHATTDGSLSQFQADNWTKVNDQFVLNVPLQLNPIASR